MQGGGVDINLVCNEENKKLQVSGSSIEIVNNAPTVEFVDLGLSVKWTKYNLGATHSDTAASWYGNYYQWGSAEVANERTCAWSDCPNTNGTYSSSNNKVFTKYIPTSKEAAYWNGSGSADNELVLDASDDPATSLGGNWRMPTKEDFEELLDITKVTNAWVTNYNDISGLNGRVFTSIANGNTLFIPASGRRSDGSVYNTGSCCYLWSSSLYSDGPYYAWNFFFLSSRTRMYDINRCEGLAVRAVCTQ